MFPKRHHGKAIRVSRAMLKANSGPTRAAPAPRLRRSVVSRPFAIVRGLVQAVVVQTRRVQVRSAVSR